MPRFNQHSATLLKRAVDSGITSPAELANLMGQTSVESLSFTRVNESMSYRNADRAFTAVTGLKNRHTRQEVEAALATHDPETIANLFYDGHPSLGNRDPGDGWRFHGRGVIQLTGRDNYKTFGNLAGVDLIANPELASDPDVSANVAIAYWNKRCKDIDPTDVHAVTVAINGGENGYRERVAAVGRWAGTITPELIEGIRNGTHTTDNLLAMNIARPVHIASAMRHGDRGDDVRELQTRLRDLGYPLHPDGDFGRATRDAVTTFQRDHDLAADGIAGARTLAAANEAHRALRSVPDATTVETVSEPNQAVTRNSSIHDMFEAMCQAGAQRDLDALCHTGHAYRNSTDGQGWLMQGERNNRQVATEALAAEQAQAQAQAQAQQQSGPVMSL